MVIRLKYLGVIKAEGFNVVSEEEMRKQMEEIHEQTMIKHRTLPGVEPIAPRATVSPMAQVERIRQIEVLAPIIQLLNCLLYTSPSPRDRG